MAHAFIKLNFTSAQFPSEKKECREKVKKVFPKIFSKLGSHIYPRLYAVIYMYVNLVTQSSSQLITINFITTQ